MNILSKKTNFFSYFRYHRVGRFSEIDLWTYFDSAQEICTACAKFPKEEYLSACGSTETYQMLRRLIQRHDVVSYKTEPLHETSWFFDKDLYERIKEATIENPHLDIKYMYLYARFICSYFSNICLRNKCSHGRMRYYPKEEPIIQKWCCKYWDEATTAKEVNYKFCRTCAEKMMKPCMM